MIRLVPLLAIMALFLGLVTVVHAQSAVNICSRTAEVQTGILAEVSGPTCSTITDTQLAGIAFLEVTGYSNASICTRRFRRTHGAGVDVDYGISLADHRARKRIQRGDRAGIHRAEWERHLLNPRGCLRCPHQSGRTLPRG